MRAGIDEETTRGGLEGWRCGSSSFACRCAVCVFVLCCRLAVGSLSPGRRGKVVSAFFVATCDVSAFTRLIHWLRLMPSLMLLLLPFCACRMPFCSFAACCCRRLPWFLHPYQHLYSTTVGTK